jgi:hypothetical protein
VPPWLILVEEVINMKTEEARQIIEGMMLGDGSLSIGPRGKNARFVLERLNTPEFQAYLEKTAEALRMLEVQLPPEHITARDRTYRGKTKQYLKLQTVSSPVLTEWRRRWIDPSNPKHRQVPPDLELTPLNVAIWLEGDGSTTRNLQWQNLVRLKLASYHFGREGNFKLWELLANCLGIEVNIYHDKKRGEYGYYLETMNTEQVTKLLDIVEPHISPPYLYKVKYPWPKAAEEIP